jgi:tRNA threonylcarbamoyladenosine biosynthesis protein TsaB
VRLIAIDCALDACQVAVADGDVVTALSEPMRKGQAERIAPMAAEAMAQSGLAFKDLARIAVTVGPGSFAGVRVGLSFARGLAVALGAPCLGYSTLEVFARSAGDDGVRGGAILAPDGVFFAAWKNALCIANPERMSVEGARAALPTGAVLLGPAADRFGFPASENWAPLAALIRLARADDPAMRPADPLYLRPPYATLPEA